MTADQFEYLMNFLLITATLLFALFGFSVGLRR